MMRDIPIIFSAPMINALLTGRKTQTRRLAWRICTACEGRGALNIRRLADNRFETDHCTKCKGSGRCATIWQRLCPYIQGGGETRLWVREGWTNEWFGKDGDPTVGYRADHDDGGVWKSPIFMPRRHSRITLVDVRSKMEGLNDISEDDAVAEGFRDGTLNDGWKEPREIKGAPGWTIQAGNTSCSAAGMFQIAWTKLHPEWDGYSSPDVVALSFRVVLNNIDKVEK